MGIEPGTYRSRVRRFTTAPQRSAKIWTISFYYFLSVPGKTGYFHNSFLISPQKHILWVLTRSASPMRNASVRRFWWVLQLIFFFFENNLCFLFFKIVMPRRLGFLHRTSSEVYLLVNLFMPHIKSGNGIMLCPQKFWIPSLSPSIHPSISASIIHNSDTVWDVFWRNFTQM